MLQAKRKQSLFLFIIISSINILLFVNSCSKAQTSDKKFEELLNQTMDSAFAKSKAIGVSVALIMPDGKMWQRACGISAKDTPLNKNMLFNIGSAQKNLEAVLVLKLVEDGILSLDDKIEKWLPVYPNINPSITIRQLLNQTDGVDAYVSDSNSPWQMGFKNINYSKKWTPDEMIATFVGKPLFEPGKGWAYSQTNYMLLRMIIEKATGSKAYTQLEKRILKPYGLNHTTAYMLNPISDSLVLVHGWLDEDYDGKADDISGYSMNWQATLVPMMVYSTPADMAKWFHLLLHEKRILKKELFEEMVAFQKTTPDEPLLSGYGLGICSLNMSMLASKWANTVAWGHSGNHFGFMSFNFYFPEYKFTFSAMINRGCDADAAPEFIAALKPLLDLTLKKFGAKETADNNSLDSKLKQLEKTPDDLKLLLETAILFQGKERDVEAWKQYGKILKLDQEKKSEYFLASLLWNSIYEGLISKKTEGLVEFINLHKDYKDLYLAHKFLIKSYFRKGEKENAIAAAEKAFQYVNGNAILINDLSWFIHISKYKELCSLAIEKVKTALEILPNHSDIWDTLGWLYYDNGEKDKAVYAEQQALKYTPNKEEFKKNLDKFK